MLLQIGSGECKACAKGEYSGLGADACTKCPVGTYQPLSQQKACLLADLGSYVAATGQAAVPFFLPVLWFYMCLSLTICVMTRSHNGNATTCTYTLCSLHTQLICVAHVDV